jgi:hypothetical protein
MAVDCFAIRALDDLLMPRVLYAAAPWWAGTWHRLRVVDHVRRFSAWANYRVHFIWGRSRSVAFCSFESLLSPIPGVRIVNIDQQDLMHLEARSARPRTLTFQGNELTIFRPGDRPSAGMFVFDIASAAALERLAPRHPGQAGTLRAVPSRELADLARAYMRDFDIPRRVGVRVRVSECPVDWRKPRRFQRELDQTVTAIARIPWHIRIFLVTDSEYVQQMLASHFRDIRYFPKRFGERERSMHYVSRDDPHAMRTFMAEISCLTSCRKIVNVGGFLNQDLVRAKILAPPYDGAMG